MDTLHPDTAHPEYVPTHPSFNGCAAASELSYPVAPSTAFGALPPGVTPTRSFASIAQAEQEGNDARIFDGMHYGSSVNVADSEGRAIAAYVMANLGTPFARNLAASGADTGTTIRISISSLKKNLSERYQFRRDSALSKLRAR